MISSIKIKYLFYFLFVSIFPLGIFAYFTIADMRESSKKKAINQLRQIALLKQNALEQHLTNLEKNLESIAINKDVRGFFTKNEVASNLSAFHLIKNLQETIWGKAHHIFVVNKDSKVVLSPPHGNSKGSHLGHKIHHPDLKKALAGKYTITDFFGFEETTHYHQLAMCPIKDSDGSVLGVIVLEIVINYQNKLLKDQFKFGDTGRIFMTTLDGQRIVNDKKDLMPALKTKAIFEAMRKGEVAGEMINDKGENVIGIYFHKINQYPWVLNIEIGQDEVYKSVNKLTNFLIKTILVIIVCVIFFSLIITGKITRPILLAENISKTIAAGDLKPSDEIKRYIDSGDEIGSLYGSLETMRVSLKDLIENLDHKIKEKTKEISLILECVPLGLMTTNMKGEVGPEYSAMCKTLFKDDIANLKASEILFANKDVQVEFQDWVDFLPMSPMSFEDNVDLCPDRSLIEKNDKHYELKYSFVPIYHDDGKKLERMMIIATDISNEEALRVENERKEKETEFILKVLRDKDNYLLFLKETIQNFESVALEIKNTDIAAAFRSIHTIKGNSSAYGIVGVTEKSHALEAYLVEGRDGQIECDEEFWKSVADQLGQLQVEFEEHITKTEADFRESLHPSKSHQAVFKISEEELDSLLLQINAIPESDLVNNLKYSITKIKLKSINTYLNPYVDMIAELADRLGKNINELTITGGDLKIDPDRFQSLFSVFIHLIRNSVDHGIETPEEREENNKSELANISIAIEKSDQGIISLIVEDDGRGINRDIVLKKGLENGLVKEAEASQLSDEDIYGFIFESGFSTKTEVTSTSGRGVGMDAIRHEVLKLNGSIKISSELGVGTKIKIDIPFEDIDSKSDHRGAIRSVPLSQLKVAFVDSDTSISLIDLSPTGLKLSDFSITDSDDPILIKLATLNGELTSTLSIKKVHGQRTNTSNETGYSIVEFASDQDQKNYEMILLKFS